MEQSIETMLSQLREHLRHLDRLIVAQPDKQHSNTRWYRLCKAYDAVEEAVTELERIR